MKIFRLCVRIRGCHSDNYFHFEISLSIIQLQGHVRRSSGSSSIKNTITTRRGKETEVRGGTLEVGGEEKSRGRGPNKGGVRFEEVVVGSERSLDWPR